MDFISVSHNYIYNITYVSLSFFNLFLDHIQHWSEFTYSGLGTTYGTRIWTCIGCIEGKHLMLACSFSSLFYFLRSRSSAVFLFCLLWSHTLQFRIIPDFLIRDHWQYPGDHMWLDPVQNCVCQHSHMLESVLIFVLSLWPLAFSSKGASREDVEEKKTFSMWSPED